MSSEAPKRTGPFPGETRGREALTTQKLISELLTEDNLSRKTEINKPFEMSALELAAFHLSDMAGKLQMVPANLLQAKDIKLVKPKYGKKEVAIVNAGGMYRALIYFYKNNMIAKDRMRVLEYVTALQGAHEIETEADLKNKRQLQSVIFGV